jgi:hypothetical protein
MATFRSKDITAYIKKEVTYGVDPTVAAADAYVTRVHPFNKRIARLDRDKDNNGSASVVDTDIGRREGDWQHEAAVIPAGNLTTPTAPDSDVIWEAHFGGRALNTANSTTTAGSAGTALNLTAGGQAAMGLAVGQLIGINVDATFGIEVRQIRALPGGDVVTLCRAPSAAVATGRGVYGGLQLRPEHDNLISLHGYRYMNGNNHRARMGGINPSKMDISADWSGETTEVIEKFSGPGMADVPFTTSIPTPTFNAGSAPLVTNQGKVWIGATKGCINKVSIVGDNGIVLRNTDSCNGTPSGLKRTGNNGNFLYTLAIDYELEAQTHYDDAATLTAHDVIVQLGDQQGYILAFCARKWRPDVTQGDIAGMVGNMLTGRCYATVSEDELMAAFI